MTEQVLICCDCTTIDPRELGPTVLGTDPPYAPRVHSGMASCAAHGKRKGVRQRDAGFAALTPELRAYLADAAAVATGWSLVYSDLEGAGAWAAVLPRHVRTVVLAEADEPPPWEFPWVRWSMPQLSGDRPCQGSEAIVLGHGPGRMHWGGPGNLMALAHKAERGDDKHPTAKPLDQALDLVAWFSDPGDLWYDPCAGRGTFGVACAMLGRNYFGCEIDSAEAAKGAARIEASRWGELNDRDRERFQRWLASIGIKPANGRAFTTQEAADVDQALSGAHFKKGLIWTPPPALEPKPVPEPEPALWPEEHCAELGCDDPDCDRRACWLAGK